MGVCTALMLQRRQHTVTLIDPRPPGSGASYGNAGCFNGSSIVPMSLPGVLTKIPGWLTDPLGPLSIRWSYLPALAPWLSRFVRAGTPEKVACQARALRSLLGPTLGGIIDLAREAGAEHLVHHDGHLVVYRSDSAYAGDRLGWSLRRNNNVVLEELNAADLRDLDPNLSHDFVRGVLIRENGHTSDPHALVTRLFEKVMANGGQSVTAEAIGFDLDTRRLTSVRTSEGPIAADVAIIAAGAHSKGLAAAAGDKIPLDTERGYHLVITGPEAAPRIPTMDAEGKFIATPMDAGLRIAGTVELGGLDIPPDWRRAHGLLRHAQRLLPGLNSAYPEERLQTWMGFRPSMPDSMPVIGRSSSSPDILYGFGHGHVGMTGAPMTAKVLAELTSGEAPSIDLLPFAATRFS